MANLVPRRSTPPVQSDELLNAEVAAGERASLGAVVRVQGVAFVATTAMHNASMLSRSADVAFRISPMGEDIYRSILLAYGSVAVAEIQALGIRSR